MLLDNEAHSRYRNDWPQLPPNELSLQCVITGCQQALMSLSLTLKIPMSSKDVILSKIPHLHGNVYRKESTTIQHLLEKQSSIDDVTRRSQGGLSFSHVSHTLFTCFHTSMLPPWESIFGFVVYKEGKQDLFLLPISPTWQYHRCWFSWGIRPWQCVIIVRMLCGWLIGRGWNFEVTQWVVMRLRVHRWHVDPPNSELFRYLEAIFKRRA